METVIRRAIPQDASLLAELGTATFVETFGRLYKPEDLQAFLDESHSVAAYAKVLADPAYALWIAEAGSASAHGRNGRAIGYAQAGPCALPHPDVRPQDGELKRLYLLKDEQNGGIGGALFAEALRWLERDGPRTLWLSVWSENLGAQRFYRRQGFSFVDEYEFPVGQQRDREFMYRRRAGG